MLLCFMLLKSAYFWIFLTVRRGLRGIRIVMRRHATSTFNQLYAPMWRILDQYHKQDGNTVKKRLICLCGIYAKGTCTMYIVQLRAYKITYFLLQLYYNLLLTVHGLFKYWSITGGFCSATYCFHCLAAHFLKTFSHKHSMYCIA